MCLKQASIVENYSFELPGDGKIVGWDMDDGAYYTDTGVVAEVPGWSSDGEIVDSGVELEWPGSTDGVWAGFLWNGEPVILTVMALGWLCLFRRKKH